MNKNFNGRLLIGIDGGGTKTRAVVARYGELAKEDLVNAERTAGMAGPSNLAAVGGAAAAEEIRNALSLALTAASGRREQVIGVCAGLAGFSHESRRAEVETTLKTMFPLATVNIVPDYVTAYVGALEGKPGVIVVGGTGSIAYGENINGHSHRAGGYGHIIDDAGSGYGVGRLAIAAMLRSLDGTGPKTLLSQAFAEELMISDFPSTISSVYGGTLDRVRIAAAAKIVVYCALRGDAVAKEILQTTGKELGRLATTVASKLFAKGVAVPVSVVGSLWDSGEILRGPFLQAVTEQFPSATISRAHLGAAVGAVLRAARLAG